MGIFSLMSLSSITKYLDKNPLQVPPSPITKLPVLVSDSLGNCLRVHHNSRIPLQFFTYSGATSAVAIDRAIPELEKLSRGSKPLVVYVWLGVCDITKKIHRGPGHRQRQIELRYNSLGAATTNILEQFDRIKNVVISKQGFLKFITIPVYSAKLYNTYLGHPNPENFETTDKFLIEEINGLNQRIYDLNQSLGRNTLQFHLDIVKVRGRGRQSFNYNLLKDGIHPDSQLSEKWLRRLELDIVNECWSDATPDVLTLNVDPQELLTL